MGGTCNTHGKDACRILVGKPERERTYKRKTERGTMPVERNMEAAEEVLVKACSLHLLSTK
jgi:hypothetical protein